MKRQCLVRTLVEISSQCYSLKCKASEGGARCFQEMARSPHPEAPGPVGDRETMLEFWVSLYVERTNGTRTGVENNACMHDVHGKGVVRSVSCPCRPSCLCLTTGPDQPHIHCRAGAPCRTSLVGQGVVGWTALLTHRWRIWMATRGTGGR